MKIEKINDNQIRCTLTREDLANREIKLSELAYGTEKAKSLFRDMMQQAAHDFGFEANNIPLMIEAIPISPDSIILITTKVEDPEELDTRFSRFSTEDDAPDGNIRPDSPVERLTGADDILDLIRKIHEAKQAAAKRLQEASAEVPEQSVEEEAHEEASRLTRFYLFDHLDDVIRVSHVLGPVYHGPGVLFKNAEAGEYYLILKMADNSPEAFNKACNILSEYGIQCSYAPGMEEYFTEHMEVIVPADALQKLSLV